MKTTPTILLVAPAMLVLGGLFGSAILFSLGQSLGAWSVVDGQAPTLMYYRRLLRDPDVLRSLALTTYVASMATGWATIGGLAFALLLRSVLRYARLLRLLAQLPLPVPHLVAAISIGLLLGQSGLLARLVNAAGVITMPAEMPALVYDPLAVGIIVTYVWKEVPFVTLVMLAALGSRLIELEQAARTLGATPLQTLRHITLPLIAPSLLGAATIVFVFTFGSFEVPVLLGQRYPRMLAVETFTYYSDTDLQLRPLALALNTLIVVVTVLASIPCLWLLRRANPAAPARDRAASTEHVAR